MSGGNAANGGNTGGGIAASGGNAKDVNDGDVLLDEDDDAAKVAGQGAGFFFGAAVGVEGAQQATTIAAMRTFKVQLHSGHDKLRRPESFLSLMRDMLICGPGPKWLRKHSIS